MRARRLAGACGASILPALFVPFGARGAGMRFPTPVKLAQGGLAVVLSLGLALGGVPAQAWAEVASDGGGAAAAEAVAQPGLESDGAPTSGPSDKGGAQAQEHLDQFLRDTRIISGGGDAVQKSADGLSYDIGYKTKNGSPNTSLNFRPLVNDKTYSYALTVEQNAYVSASRGITSGRFNIVGRPVGGDATVALTIRAYAPGTSASAMEDGNARELAHATVTLVLEPGPTTYQVDLSPVDAKTGKRVDATAVKVNEGNSWGSSVRPNDQGLYELDSTKTYYVKVTADGYEDYEDGSFRPAGNGSAGIKLNPLAFVDLSFRAVDATGAQIKGAKVVVRKGGYSGQVLSPQPDGSYRVVVGQKLQVSASADHYGQATRTLSVTEGMAASQDVQLKLSEVVVSFVGIDADGSVDAGAKVTVTHVEEDPYGEDEDETVTDRPGADGRYALALSDGPYAVTITGSDGYKARTTYEPDGSKAEDLVRLKLYDDPNQARVDALARALDDALGALRPCYRKDKNANELVRSLLAEKLGKPALEGVTVSVASTADPQRVAADGSIGYRRSSLDGSFHNPNVSCSFAFAADDCTAVSKPKSVTIGWDQDYFHSQMEVEGQALDTESILGGNSSLDSVASDLALPSSLQADQRKAYSSVRWSSSDEATVDTAGKVTRGAVDKRVTLTATLVPNDSNLNANVERAADFGSVTKVFEVTVKADPEKVASESARLQSALDDRFVYPNLSYSSGGPIPANGEGIDADLQLPTTRTLGVDGKLDRVSYSSSTDAIKVNGYAARVVRPLPGEQEGEAELTCTIQSRENPEVRASKTLRLSVKPLDSQEVGAALDLMARVKAGYAAALAAGQSPLGISKNLSTFQKAYLDDSGELRWARNVSESSAHAGVVPEQFPEYDSMGSYDQARTFRSSNTKLVLNETLQLAWNADNSTMLSLFSPQPTYNQEVTVSSVLTDERYSELARLRGDDPVWGERLRSLVSQPVSAQLRVLGTTGVDAPRPQVEVKASVIGRDAFGSPEVWAREASYALDEGSTADVLTERMLQGTGLAHESQNGQYGYYLSTISSPDGSRRLSYDQASGRYWQLFVNGVAADEGAGGITLKKGDSIVWCYSAYGDKLPEDDKRMVTAKVRVVGPGAGGADVSWVSSRELAVPEGTTAAQLSKQVLNDAGFDVDDGIYTISARSGQTLPNGTSQLGAVQGQDGGWSWWQFFVNGEMSKEYASNYVLGPGDEIVWAYGTEKREYPKNDVTVDPGLSLPDWPSEWPGFRGEGEKGSTSAATPVEGGEAQWTFAPSAGEGAPSDPVLAGGRVFVARGDVLYALDATTGKELGSAQLLTSVDSTARLVYDGGLVVVPLHGGRLQAVAADSLKTKWAIKDALPGSNGLPQQSLSTLTVQGGYLYYGTAAADAGGGSQGGYLLCVSLRDGSIRWRRENSQTGFYWSGVTLVGGRAIVADDSGAVRVLDASDGRELGTLDLGESSRAGVVASPDGKVIFVVTRDGVLHRLALGASGELREEDRVRFSDYSTSTPTLVGGRLYVGGRRLLNGRYAGGIYEIDASSMRVVSKAEVLKSGAALPGEVKSSPLVRTGEDGTYVYFTCNALPGGVYLFRAGDSGATLLYQPEAGRQQFGITSVVAGADGSLYYGNDSGMLFKLVGGGPIEQPKQRDQDGSGGASDRRGSGAHGNGGGASASGEGSGGATSSGVGVGSGGGTSTAAGDGKGAASKSTGKSKDARSASEDDAASPRARRLPLWPIVGMAGGVAVLALCLAWCRRGDEGERA
ncbi:PQQ enzyme repeat protein [Olsenella sp. DNF00959]|nr:PQQ enzyme repeat protein [Olsenella sp. DNF00959]